MSRINRIICSSILLFFLLVSPSFGGWLPWGPATLVTVDGEKFTTKDYKEWWKNWREKDMEIPQSVDSFVDWHLLFREAERMRLFESPLYRKKVLTFLKANTLMLLKGEEIDKKIKINDASLWKMYLKTHAPRSKISIFFFKKEELAQAFVDRLGTEPLSTEDFNDRHGREDGYYSQRSEWYRPQAINPGWRPLLKDLKKGNMTQPVTWKGDFVVLRLEDQIAGSREDMAVVKKQLQKKVWKTQEDRLTVELLAKLRQKYKVKIDTELLKELKTQDPKAQQSDAILISTTNGNITEKSVVAKIRQVERFRRQNGFNADLTFQFKNQVVNGIIDQTLTSWEALARRYEEEPPFQTVYQFYCQHRMIKLLEAQLFGAKVSVSEKEIGDYYQKNLALFTQQEVIRMALVEGSQEALNTLWLEVALGRDFITLAQQATGKGIPVRDIPVSHLNPKVKEIVDKLTTNEVSQVFTVDNHITLVQLIGRRPAQVSPLKEVHETIRATLHATQAKELRRDYLDKLRAKYAVELNDQVWQNLNTELETVDETN